MRLVIVNEINEDNSYACKHAAVHCLYLTRTDDNEMVI